jgi:tRNA A-37 threonylcarbamoyl transferase component Bud32
VEKLHVQGVTHGDIAGRNIIVHDKKVTLIDFGNASITTDANSRQEDMDAIDRLLY